MGDNLEKEGGNNDEIFPKEYVDYLNQLLLYEEKESVNDDFNKFNEMQVNENVATAEEKESVNDDFNNNDKKKDTETETEKERKNKGERLFARDSQSAGLE